MWFLVDLWRSVTGNKHKETVKMIPMSYKNVIKLLRDKYGIRVKRGLKEHLHEIFTKADY